MSEPEGSEQGSPARLTGPERSLELDESTLRHWTGRVLDRIVAHLATVEQQPAAYRGDPAAEVQAVRAEPPEHGEGLETLLAIVFDRAVPWSFNTAGPGYMAYIPGGGIYHAALADLISGAVNRYVGVYAAAPLLAEIESDVLRWLAHWVGFPRSARGLLTTGGSLANFTALFTARRERLAELELVDGVVYTSDQAHHSVLRAAVLAGIPERNVVALESDERFRLRPGELRERIHADRARGRKPFLIVASAGTTNSGAVDPLEELADLAAAEQLWLHVDAAYGGFFCLTERGRSALRGMERADSLVLDPHKGMFLPYGTGALLVRDGEALRRAHVVHADYMPPKQAGSGAGAPIDFCDHGPELSRGFRGLRLWLPLRLHGVGVFRAYLDEKLDLARWAAAELASIEGIEIVAAPELSTLAFRLTRPGLTQAEIDRLNEQLLAEVLEPRRVWLTSTRLRGRVVIRISVLHFRTHRERVAECLELVREAALRLRLA